MAGGFIQLKFSEASLSKLMANLINLDLRAKQGAKRALKTVAENIISRSILECPMDTGALVNSTYIEEPKETVNGVSIKLGYGGVNDKCNPDTGKMASEYALVVHETPEFKHKKGKWKFLEDPVTAHKTAFLNTLKTELQVVFAKGVTPR